MKLAYKLFFLLTVSIANSQVPNYYQSVNLNVQGESLKNQLSNLIISTHSTELIYTPDVWNVLKQADVDPNNNDKVLLLYGWNDTDATKNNDKSRDKNASCHTSNCDNKWVREHVFPRSKGTPNLEFEGPGSDAHHLHAIDYDRNSLRSNFKFIANPTSYITYSRIIQQNGSDYFYPGDEWKGDVARMIMYMYVRYNLRCQPINVGYGSTSYSVNGDMPNIFLQWNAEDPVSTHEINRNEKIFQAQGNRNPFIDNPYLATLIWNGPAAENKWQSLNTESPYFEYIAVYPTQTESHLNIAGITLDTQTTFTIIDLTGRIIQQGIYKEKIDVSTLSKGMYFLELNIHDTNKIFKFIKK